MIGVAMQSSKQKSNRLGRKAASSTGRFIYGLFRLLMKLTLVVVFLAVGLFVGGFFQFANKVSSYTVPGTIRSAQGIVALTGGSARISDALKLISEKKGERLLISGVNVGTTMADILKINSDHEAATKCCVDLERKAQDTIGNAVETQKWMQMKGYKSLILVTSDYHMPRSLLEFRRVMPKVTITPYPVKLDSLTKEGWWKNSKTLRFMMSEYLKYVGAWSRDYLSPKALSALRATLFGG